MLKIKGFSYFKEHRSGWNYVMDLLSRHADENGVLLVDVYDSSCNNAIIECVVRHTPARRIRLVRLQRLLHGRRTGLRGPGGRRFRAGRAQGLPRLGQPGVALPPR